MKANKSERVVVNLRIRPMSDDEKRRDSSTPIESIDTKRNTLSVKKDYESKSFSYDKIFPTSSCQKDVFESSSKAVVESVLKGYNGTIFAYGQTGTGKTYTMVGDFEHEINKGIVPRSIDYIFEQIKQDKEHKYNIMVSFIQIYLETIQDLLEPKNKDIRIREDPDHGVYLEGVQWIKVNSTSDCGNVFQYGEKNRVTESTRMNAHSSRSHAILIVCIEKSIILSPEKIAELSKESNEQIKSERVMTKSMLYLVDLAGSERVKKTKSENMRLEEAKKINYSLLILGNCIKALTDNKCSHVSYRDSKLTRLLQESLGGNAKTCLIVTVSPSGYNTDETVSSLNFALRAMKVQNKPMINKSIDYQALCIKLQEDLDKLNDQYALLKIDYDKLQDENDKMKSGEAYLEIQRKTMAISMQQNSNNNDNTPNKDNSIGDKKKQKSQKKVNDYSEEIKKLELFYEEVLKTKTEEYENILKEIDKILLDKENEIENLNNNLQSFKDKIKSQSESIIDLQKEKEDLMKSVSDLTNKLHDEEETAKTKTFNESKIQIDRLNTTIESLESKIIQLEKQNDLLGNVSSNSIDTFIIQLEKEIKKASEAKNELLQQKNNFVIKYSQNEIKIKIDSDDITNLNSKLNTVTEEMKKIIQARIAESSKKIKTKQDENKIILDEKNKIVSLITDHEKDIEYKTELIENIKALDDITKKDKTTCLCELMLSESNFKLMKTKYDRDQKYVKTVEEEKHGLRKDISILQEQNNKLSSEISNLTDKIEQIEKLKESMSLESNKHVLKAKQFQNTISQLKDDNNTLLKQIEVSKIDIQLAFKKHDTFQKDLSQKDSLIETLKTNNNTLTNELNIIKEQLNVCKDQYEIKNKEIIKCQSVIDQLTNQNDHINNELNKKDEVVKSSINVNENFNREMKIKLEEYTNHSQDNKTEIDQLKTHNHQLQSIVSTSTTSISQLYKTLSQSIASFSLFEEEFKKVSSKFSQSQSADLTTLGRLIDSDILSDEEDTINDIQTSLSLDKGINLLLSEFQVTDDKIEAMMNNTYALALIMEKSIEDNTSLKRSQIDKLQSFLAMISSQDIDTVPLIQKRITGCNSSSILKDVIIVTNEVYYDVLTKYLNSINEKNEEINHLNDRIEYFIKELDIIKKTNDEISKGSSSTSKIQNIKYESQLKLKNEELGKTNRRLEQLLKTIASNKKEISILNKEVEGYHNHIKLLQERYDKQSKSMEVEQQHKLRKELKLANKDLNTGKYLIKEFIGKTSKFAIDLSRYCEKSNDS